MKKWITYLATGLLIAGAPSLMAQSATNSVNTPGAQAPGAHRDRGAIMKLLGLTPADLKGLTREERQAKIKETANTIVSQLQAKKASGTLTSEEQTKLDRIEKFLAHASHKAAGE